jgi:lipoyl-dependent peroxiredoxin
MPVREANAVWQGSLKDGDGQMRFGSGAFEGKYSFGSRFEESTGTNPEELIGAAHAGCFSMALSAALTAAGHTPERIDTTAKVHLDKSEGGFSITRVELQTNGVVPGLDEGGFQEHAEQAKQNCPVSRALAGVEIQLAAQLAS